MKIKRLDILGFKSFVDKVSIDFQQGITGVVGPNGCGKSNIVDAIRWVMGEQNARHLRGRAMEDIIFGGSESRKPHGMAQVSIVFDNSAKICPAAYQDYAEIMVTRRLYRNGESEYLINKTVCRLLDITELFMDTGVGARAYSIIEQGKVGMLVSARPEERRVLIEEAAGVTKFKARKKTALRKMDATKQNLVRLGDIISEVRRQLGSLKRQAQRAEQFREYRGETRRIELCLTGNRFQELQREIELLAKQEQEQATILARLDARLEDGDLQLEEKLLQMAVVEAELNQAQEQVYHLAAEIQRVENELTLATRQREHLQKQGLELQAELKLLTERQAVVAKEQQTLQQEQASFTDRLKMAQQEVEQKEERLRQALSQEQQLDANLDANRRKLMELLAEASRLANRREELDRRLAVEVERRQQLRADSVRVQEQQQLLQEQQCKLEAEIVQVREQREQLQEQERCLQQNRLEQDGLLKEQDAELTKLRQQLEKSRSRLESLQELENSLDGYAEGVRVLLSDSQPWKQVAADLFKVAPEYELALEIALGERLQAVPLTDIEQLDMALLRLQDAQQRATLLLPSVSSSAVNFSGGTALTSLVEARSGQQHQVDLLLSGVYLVDSVRAFTTAKLSPGLLLVDDEGGSLSWRGELTGGAKIADGAGLLRKKRQLTELAVEVAQLEQVFATQQRECGRLREELLQLDEEHVVVANTGHRLELQALELAKDKQGLVAESGRIAERFELITFDLEQSEETEAALQQEKDQLSVGSQQSVSRQRQLEDQVAGWQEQLSGLRQQLDSTREELTERRVALAAMQQQQSGLQDTLARLAAQGSEMQLRAEQLQKRQHSGATEQRELLHGDERLRVELNLLLDRRAEQQQGSQTIRQGYEQQRQQLDEFRDQLRGVRVEAEELRKEVARLQLRHHELQVDAEAIRQGVLERYRVDLLEHQVPEATADELERQQHQLQRLQRRIEALGEVNLMAIDEYREQEERYDFLCQQRDDLHQSLADLQKAIGQINRTTRRRFKETFDLVNEKFQQVFPRLFRGGQAELRLTDEDDLLETGIDIIVQPPGKRLQSVNLLSGGEKALTAVALIFSLFLIKPTPFCVLDEVDAPLDDVNIDRFAEMVAEMTAQSQFIIITHSKRTMRIVDTMYGVTMQEPGVSKLVSVRINEAREGAGPVAASA